MEAALLRSLAAAACLLFLAGTTPVSYLVAWGSRIAFLRPVLFILTLPLTVVTLGLFLLVLNALMIMLVAWMLPGFHVAGFWSGVGAAIITGVVSWIAAIVIGDTRQQPL